MINLDLNRSPSMHCAFSKLDESWVAWLTIRPPSDNNEPVSGTSTCVRGVKPLFRPNATCIEKNVSPCCSLIERGGVKDKGVSYNNGACWNPWAGSLVSIDDFLARIEIAGSVIGCSTGSMEIYEILKAPHPAEDLMLLMLSRYYASRCALSSYSGKMARGWTYTSWIIQYQIDLLLLPKIIKRK